VEGGRGGTLHFPPVAIFIAQALQRQGCRQGTVKCVTFSFPQARQAEGITRGEVSSSSSEEEDEDDASSSSTDGCFRFRLEMSGIVEWRGKWWLSRWTGRVLRAEGMRRFRGAEGLILFGDAFVWGRFRSSWKVESDELPIHMPRSCK
jgi:hypothetical protein